MLTRRRALMAPLLGMVALAALTALFALGGAPAQAQDDDTTTTIIDGGGGARGYEPTNVQVTPGDGELTVSWTVTSRPGVDDDDIYHALRWSQVAGVFHNDSMPRHPDWVIEDDPDLPPINGMLIEPGVTSYKITGLKNRVVTGVHVRSFTGVFRSQDAQASSRWVRVKGKDTTPVADEVIFNAAGYAVSEGGTVSLGISRYGVTDASLNDPLTVTLATADGTAASTDYTAFSGRSVAMAANAGAASSSVVTASDDLVEEDETLTVTISVPETSIFGAGDPSTTTVTIEDDDRANARIAFGSGAASTTKYTATVAEAVTGGTLNVPVTVSHLPGASTTFAVEVLSGSTAGEGSDFSIAAKSVTFGPADTSKTKNVAIALTNDADYENDETIELRIVAADTTVDDLGDHYARDAAGSTATVTVTSEDARSATKTYSVSSRVTATEGENAEITLTLGEAAPTGGLKFNVVTTYRPPGEGGAFPAETNNFRGTHTVAAGKSADTISIPLPTDELVERPEDFTVIVTTDDIRWSVASARANRTRVIINDGTRAKAKIAFGTDAGSTTKYTATVAENSPAGYLDVPISISHAPGDSFGVRVEVLKTGTATPRADYRIDSASVSFSQFWSKTQNLRINLSDDSNYEQDETIELRIVAADDPANDLGDHYARHASGATATITITSDESHYVIVSEASLTTAEGGTATYTVVLTDEPTADVTVTPGSSTAAATVSGPVTFTRSNWSVPQGITVTGVSAGDAAISHSVSSADANFSSSKTFPVNVTVTARAAPTPTPTPEPTTTTPTKFYEIASAVTAAEGRDAALTVTLSEAAPADLTFKVNYKYGGSTADADDTPPRRPTTVRVAAGNTTATLRVPIARDSLVEPDETLKLSITPGQGVTTDWGAKTAGAETAVITIKDTTITVSLGSATYSVGEGDGSLSIPITFGSAIPEDVTALMTVTNAGSGKAATRGEDFTSSILGMNIAQGSTTASWSIGIVNDSVAEADEKIAMSFKVTPSAGYSVRAPRNVVITIADDDTAGVTVSESARSVMEKATATYTVTLTSKPTAGVTVTPASSATAQATVSGPVTFTTDNWNQPKTVTVTGVAEGAATISHAASSSDTFYAASLSIDSVAITVTPSSVYEISATATASEGGNADLTITLFEDAPASGLEFTVTPAYAAGSGKATAADLDSPPSTVSVTENARTATLSIPIAKDALAEGDETFTVTIATSAQGWNKRADGADTATVTITDDATAGVTVTPETLSVVEYGEAAYSVVLNTEPTANVTVTPTSGATANATVSGPVTFTTDNWDTPQSITVSGVLKTSAGAPVSISHAVAANFDGVRDAAYDGLTNGIGSVAVTVTPYGKSYEITPAVIVDEGAFARLAITLGETVTLPGGLTFEIEGTFDSPAPGKAQASDLRDSSVQNVAKVAISQNRVEVSIPIAAGDLFGEGDETFTVSIKNVHSQGSPVPEWKLKPGGTATATVTIKDSDASIAFGEDAAATTGYAVSVAENVSGGTLNVPVTVSHLPAESTTFTIEVAGTGTATAYTDGDNPGDYRIAEESVTFGPTDSSRTRNVAIAITDDNTVESPETILLSIAAAADPAVNLGDRYARHAAGATATVTINSDEAATGSTKTYAIASSVTADEGENAGLTVTLGENAPKGGVEFTVSYDYTSGARGSRAYAQDTGSARPTTFTVEGGSKTGTLSVPIARDAIEEGTETFTVTITTAASGWAVASDGVNTATVSITDTTEAMRFSAGGYTVIEGNAAQVVVTRTGSTERAAQASLTGFGYGPLRGLGFLSRTVTIPAGASAAAAVIQTNDDDKVEGDGTFSFILGSPSAGYRLTGQTYVSLVIKDNDGAQQYASTYTMDSAVTANEGENAELTVTLGEPAHEDGLEFAVYYDYSQGGATEDDTGATPTTLAMTAGSSTATLSVPIARDADDDSGETFIVSITPGVNDADWTLAPSGSASATVTISGQAAVVAQQEQQDSPPNQAPTVASGIGDVTMVKESGTQDVSLSGVFDDADSDSLTITAESSDETKATVAVAADYSKLTVTAKARGTATITVTADDGNGGTVSDSFTVTVKAAPVVASAIADVASLATETGTEITLSGVFSDADGDSLTVTAASSDDAKATVSVSSGYSKLTVTGVAEGTATITVTAEDADGNRVSDAFDVTVVKSADASLSALSLSAGSIAPVFSSTTYAYTLTVGNGVSSVTVTATAHHSGATLKAGLSGSLTTVSGGTASGAISLAEGANTVQVEVTAQDGTTKQTYAVTVTRNRLPTVASGIGDVTIVNESGTQDVSLSGVFDDADGDSLTVTAASSDETKATVAVAADYSKLTVTAKARGAATITVTAADGNGGTVSDSFTVTVKAAPVVASAIADVASLTAAATQDVSLSGVFSDADNDSLTITAASSDDTKATVSVAADYSKLTVTGVAEGTAAITVTAEDADGNRVSDAFDVTVVELPGPVVGLTLEKTTDGLSVSWQAPESGGAVSNYIVHARPVKGGTGSGMTKYPKAGKLSVIFANIEAGRTYRVWARAQNAAGKGERSHATIELPPAPTEAPGPVVNLELTATADSVTARWEAPEAGGPPTRYIAHIRPEGGKAGSGKTKYPKTKKPETTFRGLEAGKTYKVWVRGENATGKGERVHATITLPEGAGAE